MEKHKNFINKKKKQPFNVFSKKGLMALAMAGVMIASPLTLTACSDGKDGIDGTRWESGLDYTEFADAKVGDFFIDTDDYILYRKTETKWEIVMRDYGKPGDNGEKGDKGEEANDIEMKVSDGKIQWRYKTGEDVSWKDLIDVSTLKGANGDNGYTPYIQDGYWYINNQKICQATGDNGADGKEIEIQKTDTAIQWRYEGDSEWTDLVALSTIKGVDGTDGKTVEIALNNGNIQWRYTDASNEWQTIIATDTLRGSNGKDGTTPNIGVNGNWYIGETDTKVKAAGVDGREVKLQVNEDVGYIQWQYEGETNWTNLIEVSTLKGADGATWFTGNEVTTGDLTAKVKDAKSGDLYLNTETYDIFKNNDGTWEKIGNIKGTQGEKGESGVSITKIEKTSTDGLVDTYTITYSNNTTSTFTVTNGAKGTDGTTPKVEIKEGYWYINDVTTGVKAAGEDGVTPTITIDNDGYWVINGTKSNVMAKAINGTNGTDGATWITGEEDPTATQGKDGDLYLNTTTYDVFKKASGAWGTAVANLKGTKGDTGATGNGIASIDVDASNTDTSKTVLKITFTDGTSKTVDVKNGTAGEDGVSITKIEKTSTDGLVDTYTITYSKGDPTTFTVTNGKDGATWYTGEATLENISTSVTGAKSGDLYLNTSTYDIFKNNDGTWTKIGNIKGATGTAGADGATWITGTAVTGTAESNTATVANSKVGDLYINSTTCDVYTCTAENTWKWLCNIKGAQGEQGNKGESGEKGEQGTSLRYGTTTPNNSLGNDGDMYINTSNWYVYAKENGSWNYKGCIKGDKGDRGTDGASTAGELVYTGFDGYVWQGATRTSIQAAQTGTVDENIRENTLAITETMKLYYPGSYLDLTSNQIAIMSSYFPTIGKTQYSGTKISSITIYAEKAGELYIGTASVADVINAKKNSLSSITCSTTAYTVVAGKNEIILNLQIGDNETLVIGGNNSVGIYYATGIPVPDTIGAYALINGEYNADIIQMTNNYNDTLAIEIKVAAWSQTSEIAYIDTLAEAVVDQVSGYKLIDGSDESYGIVMAENSSADPGYSGKTISKLGFIFANTYTLKKGSENYEIISYSDTNQPTEVYVYAYVIKKTIMSDNSMYATKDYIKKYKLTFNTFTLNNSSFNRAGRYIESDYVKIGTAPWSYTTNFSVYDDTSKSYASISGISIGSDEMIAFVVGNCDIMLVTDYSNATKVQGNPYTQYGTKLCYWYKNGGGASNWDQSLQCAFPVDMYYVGDGATVSFEENYAKLEAEEAEAIELNKAKQVRDAYTNGKTISFLGDSLTAFAGWSDNGNYNSTLDGYDSDSDGTDDVDANYNSYGNGALSSSGITSVDQTWWKQAADDMGMTVLVNNSSSGSKATQTSQDGGTVKSGIDRCTQLHNDAADTDVNPDIIAVYLGINDMLDTSVTVDTFKTAYTTIIEKIQTKYTSSEIVVFTLPYIKLINGELTGFVDLERLTAFNDAIKAVGEENGCTVVEVYPNYSWTADNWTEYCITDINDGLGHPNAEGMDLITNAFIDTLYKTYVS